MKIKLLVLGKTTEKAIAELISIYEKKLSHYSSFEMEIIENTAVKSEQPESVKESESILLLKRIKETDFLVLLDENGEQYDSVGFSKKIQIWLNSGKKQMIFVVGGAFGFHEIIYKRAQAKISLSKMTMSHQIVRPVFLEQLYRAFTILKNEPYHHK
jgi:23S rRNA (pseudouridine1915-N3)-methyltransferase